MICIQFLCSWKRRFDEGLLYLYFNVQPGKIITLSLATISKSNTIAYTHGHALSHTYTHSEPKAINFYRFVEWFFASRCQTGTPLDLTWETLFSTFFKHAAYKSRTLVFEWRLFGIGSFILPNNFLQGPNLHHCFIPECDANLANTTSMSITENGVVAHMLHSELPTTGANKVVKMQIYTKFENKHIGSREFW